MVNKLLLTLLFIGSYISASAQIVYQMSDSVNKIAIGSQGGSGLLEYMQINETDSIEHSLSYEITDEGSEWNLNKSKKSKYLLIDTLINISDIKTFTPKDYEALFKGKRIIFSQDSSYKEQLSKYTESIICKMLLASKQTWDSKKGIYTDFRWEPSGGPSFYNYYFVKIGDKHIFHLYDTSRQRSDSYIVPLENGYLYYLDRQRYYIPYSKYIKMENDLDDSISADYTLKNNYFITEQDNGKYNILDFASKNVLGRQYDTIAIMKDFIVGKNKDIWDIYNFSFRKLPFNKVRAVYGIQNSLYMLDGNKFKTIDRYGKEKKLKKENFIASYPDLPNWTANYNVEKDLATGSIKLLIERGERRQYLDNYFYRKEIIFGKDTTDIRFVNNEHKYSASAFGFLYVKGHPGVSEWIIIQCGDKYGISYIDLKNRKPEDDISIVEILPAVYDAIISELPSPFTVRLFKDGLIGLYPVIKQPRYKWLGKKEWPLMRFTLPDNRKGWLEVETGYEYMD